MRRPSAREPGIVEQAAASESLHQWAGPPLDKQQIELVGRAHLETRLLKAGFEVARPIRDKGFDLIAYSDVQGGQFFATPIQMKASSGTIFSLDRKYENRGIIYAFIWHILEAPRLFLVPYEDAVAMLPDSSAQSDSWKVHGRWYTGKPSVILCERLAQFEDSFPSLMPAGMARWREKTIFTPSAPEVRQAAEPDRPLPRDA